MATAALAQTPAVAAALVGLHTQLTAGGATGSLVRSSGSSGSSGSGGSAALRLSQITPRDLTLLINGLSR